MKTPLFISLGTVLVLLGCSDNSSRSTSTAGTNAAASSGNPLTAPVDYLSAVANAQQTAVKTVDTVSLNQAVQQFGVDHGRNPKDLNELISEKYIKEIPTPPYGTRIDYDANSGRVSVVKQ